MDDEIVKRKTVQDIWSIKCTLLSEFQAIETADTRISSLFEEINGYSPYHIQRRFDNFEENNESKYIDKWCWTYFVKLFKLENYMLCTNYKKMRTQIEACDFPEFTIENAESWLSALKESIYDYVRLMMKTVYKNLTEETYYTGSSQGYRQKKKRNNNGIDSSFIIYTHDYFRVFAYSSSGPTVTDDLEKLCYILDGKNLPDRTIIDEMQKEKKSTISNPYFTISLKKNGNTHYKLSRETRNKLNIYGADPSQIIDKHVKIKIFDRKGW
jgi:hypothetical protein